MLNVLCGMKRFIYYMHYKYHSYIPVPKYFDYCIYAINFPEVGERKCYCTVPRVGLACVILSAGSSANPQLTLTKLFIIAAR
jgi:hypothetical protein